MKPVTTNDVLAQLATANYDAKIYGNKTLMRISSSTTKRKYGFVQMGVSDECASLLLNQKAHVLLLVVPQESINAIYKLVQGRADEA